MDEEMMTWVTIYQIFEGMKAQPAVPLAEIAQLLQAAEEAMSRMEGEWHSFGHVSERYYYEYFCGGGAYEEAPVDMGGMWRYFGEQLDRAGQTEEAMAAFERALKWNPVDAESLFALIDDCRREGDLERFREMTDEAYDLCNTRALLARYYRDLGFYYLETYQPELAEALYLYSELFYPTKEAVNELSFLSSALKRKTPAYREEELRAFLEKWEIPTEASTEMLELSRKAAEDCEAEGRREEAKECYLMLYDVTGSPRVLERLEAL